jgi:quercetin dioxygenase-like cupin family protein
MNLKRKIENTEIPVVAKKVLKEKANATLIQLKKDAVLKEHQSMTNAMLVLLDGAVTYREKKRTETLSSNLDFIYIPNHITHKVLAEEDSLLLLVQ